MKKILTIIAIPFVLNLAGCSTSQPEVEKKHFVVFGTDISNTFTQAAFPEYDYYRDLSTLDLGKQYKKTDITGNKFFLDVSDKKIVKGIKKESIVYEDINECRDAFEKDKASLDAFINDSAEQESADDKVSIRYGSVGYSVEYTPCVSHGMFQSNYSIYVGNEGDSVGGFTKNITSKF